MAEKLVPITRLGKFFGGEDYALDIGMGEEWLIGEINYTLVDYAFEWPRSESWTNFVVALGYGSLYNHSNTPNANWTNDVENKTFIFFSTKPIKKGEEIFIYYGDENYWSDGRTHVEVK